MDISNENTSRSNIPTKATEYSSELIDSIEKSISLKTRFKVNNEFNFMELLTILGYREDKMWAKEENETLEKLMEFADKVSNQQVKIVQEWENDGRPDGFEIGEIQNISDDFQMQYLGEEKKVKVLSIFPFIIYSDYTGILHFKWTGKWFKYIDMIKIRMRKRFRKFDDGYSYMWYWGEWLTYWGFKKNEN